VSARSASHRRLVRCELCGHVRDIVTTPHCIRPHDIPQAPRPARQEMPSNSSPTTTASSGPVGAANMVDLFEFSGPLTRMQIWGRLFSVWAIGICLTLALSTTVTTMRSTAVKDVSALLALLWAGVLLWVYLASAIRRARQLSRRALRGFFIFVSIATLLITISWLAQFVAFIKWTDWRTYASVVSNALIYFVALTMAHGLWFFGLWAAPHERKRMNGPADRVVETPQGGTQAERSHDALNMLIVLLIALVVIGAFLFWWEPTRF